jgi:hypothetical protein
LGERIARLCGAIAIIQVPHIVSVYEVKHLRCREKNQLECRKLYFWPKFQVGAQTIIEMKDKKLRIEDALNATRVA